MTEHIIHIVIFIVSSILWFMVGVKHGIEIKSKQTLAIMKELKLGDKEKE